MCSTPAKRILSACHRDLTRVGIASQKGNAMHLTRSFGHGISRRAVLNRFAGAGALAALTAAKGPTHAFALFTPAPAVTASKGEVLMAQTTPTAETAPTVVLVHGAFADA